MFNVFTCQNHCWLPFNWVLEANQTFRYAYQHSKSSILWGEKNKATLAAYPSSVCGWPVHIMLDFNHPMCTLIENLKFTYISIQDKIFIIQHFSAVKMAFSPLCWLVVLAEVEGHVMMFTCDKCLVQPHEQDWPSTLFQLLKLQFSENHLLRSWKVDPLPHRPQEQQSPKICCPHLPSP